MNEMHILSSWPGWAEKTPEDLLRHEAWSMRVRWGDDEARLRFSDNRPRDVLALKIAFDDEEHFLGIGERETFADPFNLSQHQGLFQRVSSSHQWPEYWSFGFESSLSNEYSGLISFRIDWFDLCAVQGTFKESSPAQFKSIILGGQ